ncbi:FtsK/SpoIIIE domain-containing protein [Saccharomonospora sp. NPDC006951]
MSTEDTNRPGSPGEGWGTVHYLPAQHTATEPDSAEVIEGELVTTEPRTTWGTRLLHGPSEETRQKMADGAVVLSHKTAPQVKRGGKALVREVYYVGKGTVVALHRVWQAKTNSGYERDLRAARAAGNNELYLEIEHRAEQAREHRHRRRMDLITTAPLALIKAAALGAVGVAGMLLALGVVLAVAQKDADMILAPVSGVIEAITWTYWFAVTWGFLLLTGAAVAGVAALRWLGKTHGQVPPWAAPVTTSDVGRDVVPDEGAIVAALRSLGYGPLNTAFKEGWQPRWVSATTRVGNGYHTQLLLPRQVPVEEVAKRKNVLAHNLLRKPIEVWPTEPKDQPGVLDLWVADQGILTEPVAAWPLLHEGECDYFKGVPVAVDARGDQIIGRLMACNYLIAGIMGSGKSSLVICLLLGAMLDPLVRIDVHVLAYNVDYDPMRPRLASLVKGDEEEHIEAAMHTLRALVGEVSERGRILESLGGEEAKLTRDIAKRDQRMRPRVVVFDEVHELFTHKKHGEEAKELALKVTKKARKTGITLLWITPDADAASLPRGIAKTASHRVAFAINDHQGNDAILGTGMHKRGYSATTLVAGEDVGTAMAAGFAKVPGLIRSHYVRKEKGTDEITPVVQRAVALRDQHGLTDTTPAALEPADTDPLVDIAAVLGQAERMKTREVLQRLSERDRATYGDWTYQRLREYLAEHDAAPYKSHGAMQVSAARVTEAITARDNNSDNGDPEGADDE